MSAADIPRDEVASAMAVRQELGKEYEPEVIEAFAERLEKTIDARIESRLGQQQPLVVRGIVTINILHARRQNRPSK